VTPITAARRRYSPTVDRLMPTVTAISRSLTPRACRSKLLELSASALSRRASDLPLLGRKGGLVRDSIAVFESVRPVSTGWPNSIGMGGRLPSESVAGLHRITHESCVEARPLLPCVHIGTDTQRGGSLERRRLRPLGTTENFSRLASQQTMEE
jgi:hypothetical protein